MKFSIKVFGLLIIALLLFSGCNNQKNDTPFSIQVDPVELKGFSIPGQSIHYLVTVQDEEKDDAVTISATALGASVQILQNELLEGQVAEVIVVPDTDSTGKKIEVLIEGKRGSIKEEITRSFEVIEGEDDRKEKAVELLAPFIAYLEEAHPELNITSDTKWEGTMVSPQWLVVSHYLFFSEEWELHLEWHVMIPPSDWVRIDLRHRSDETQPSLAFEISSLASEADPMPIEVPVEIWR